MDDITARAQRASVAQFEAALALVPDEGFREALTLAFEQMAEHLINDAGEHTCGHSHSDAAHSHA